LNKTPQVERLKRGFSKGKSQRRRYFMKKKDWRREKGPVGT